MVPTLDTLLTNLEAAKSDFQPGATSKIRKLLWQISRRDSREAKDIIRFHEALLFLRAFPHSAEVVQHTEKLLDTFYERVERVLETGADMSEFDDFDTSGIAGTTMQDTLSFEAARWAVRRIPRNVEIAWKDYDEERAMGATWPRFIPLLAEDSDVEANIPWRKWLDAARGKQKDFEWLIRQFEQLKIGAGQNDRARAEIYDSLRLPLRWNLENLKTSRTRNWSRPRKVFFHTKPLITRKEVSLAEELARPSPVLKKMPVREGELIVRFVREVMLVRYRELYGTTLADPRSVVRAEVGRGVVIYLWNLPPERRLPLRAYVAGFTVKNGVPINYIEAIGLCEWIEVGFNTFYTYRQGETAWVYAQALRCLRAFTGAKTISVYPYQIGQNNDEALDSGAFWFYRKLGFRSGDAALETLARKEELKIAEDPGYRTPRRILKQLAEAHLFYDVERAAGTPTPGSWDTFSTRNIAFRVNRRMAREFAGDVGRICTESVTAVTRMLRIDTKRWSPWERHSLENWSMVLAMTPSLPRWSSAEKHDLVKMIRSQAGNDEMDYLRRTQSHPRFREELLRLGSK